MKPRILFLVHLPPPLHGQSMMNSLILESTSISSNFQTDTVNLSLSNSIDEINKFKLKKLVKVFSQYFHFLHKIATKRFDLIYISLTPFGTQFIRESPFILISKLFNIPVVSHLHAKGVKSYIGESRFKLKMYKWIFKNTYLIHLSDSLFKDIPFTELLLNKFTLPNGIPELKKSEDIKASGGSFNLLLISNLIPSKGGLQCIKAVDWIRKHRKDIIIKLDLVGGVFDYPYYEQLNSYIEKNYLQSSVSIVGPKKGNEKLEYLQNADVFVFPTTYPKECLPLVILESFSFGVPVISTKEGAIQDIIVDEENGYLLEETDNPQELAQKIISLYDNPDQREKMSLRALNDYNSKYKIGIFEQKLTKILDKILSDSRKEDN